MAPPTADGQIFDSARGDFAGHFDNSGDSGLIKNAPRPQVVAGPNGTPAFSFTMPGGGTRAEVLPRVAEVTEGQQVWLHYQAQFHHMPVDTDTWQLVLQWHQASDSGSPPVAVEVGHGQLRLANQGTHQQSLGPVGPDDTVDLTLHVRFSRDPSQALVEAWRGPNQVLAGYHPPGGTLLDASNYLKTGIYRDDDITQPAAVTLTRLRQGPTPTSVGATPDSTLRSASGARPGAGAGAGQR